MRVPFTTGQAVRIKQKCVLSGTVPKNSKGYTHIVLRLGPDDKYTGAGIIEEGFLTTVIDNVSHGTGTKAYPVVRIRGIVAVCHERFLETL